MGEIRKSAVSGTFYPSDPSELKLIVADFLSYEHDFTAPPRAIIAPHAGYIYSGPIAGKIYGPLKKYHSKFNRIILIGPAHRIPVQGLALSSAEYFETPLGKAAVDPEGSQKLLNLPFVSVSDQAHAMEHCLEVQLPFLQEVLDDFSFIPILAGYVNPEDIAEAFELLQNPKTLIVVSSDLSHYLEYEEASRLDLAASKAIESLSLEQLKDIQACGAGPIRGLLHFARTNGLRGKTVCLANSGDTAGSRDQVVGYGAYVFS
jgi:MEMO1 family protein